VFIVLNGKIGGMLPKRGGRADASSTQSNLKPYKPQKIMSDDDSSDDDFFESLLNDDEDDEEEDEIMLFFMLEAYTSEMASAVKRRLSFYVRNRLEWGAHVAELAEEGPHAFSRLYRLQPETFAKLCRIIDPFIRKDTVKASNRSGHDKGPITTEIALHCLLRWLSGGSYLDIRLSVGISVPSFYRLLHACMKAILLCDELKISFPATDADLQAAADDFKSVSSHGVIDGCVGCLDGILLKIQTPASKDVGNVKSFFSGHYQTYGINVQAACDYQSRFTSVCIAAPGGSNDIAAFRKTPLQAIVNALPVGKYIIGDNAYICSENLLTPFSGKYYLV
jgi:DDE superfamily endonuclease